MKVAPIPRGTRLVVALAALFALGSAPSALAQGGAATPKKGWLDRQKGKDDGNNGSTPATGTPTVGVAILELGDTAVGVAGGGLTHKVKFEAVKGTRVNLTIASAEPSLLPVARLVRPGGLALASFAEKKGPRAAVVIEDRELEETGLWVIEIAFPDGASASYELTTAGRFPEAVEQDLAFEQGRPLRFSLEGMRGRKLRELRIEGLPREDLQLYAELVDPDGLALPLEDALFVATDGDRLVLDDLELPILGTYELRVMDRNRSETKARLEILFDNPPPGKGVKRL